jgi:hypothetical protein
MFGSERERAGSAVDFKGGMGGKKVGKNIGWYSIDVYKEHYRGYPPFILNSKEIQFLSIPDRWMLSI